MKFSYNLPCVYDSMLVCFGDQNAMKTTNLWEIIYFFKNILVFDPTVQTSLLVYKTILQNQP